MEYTPLADPFFIHFKKDNLSYEARIVYAKSSSSCANFFKVEITSPAGIEPFCLKEKPILSKQGDMMVWVDENESKVCYTR